MFYQKAAYGALVLKSGLFRFYTPLCIPSKCNTCKAMLQTWFFAGKHLELASARMFVY